MIASTEGSAELFFLLLYETPIWSNMEWIVYREGNVQGQAVLGLNNTELAWDGPLRALQRGNTDITQSVDAP